MTDNFSIVVLPFLKTSGPVQLGGLELRSTEDTAGLPEERAAAVREVGEMLFAQDNYRIKAASYALIAVVDLDRTPHDTAHLEDIQSVIAYLYSSPHQVFGRPFFHSEYATVILFTPSVFPIHLTRPVFNVIPQAATAVDRDQPGQVRDYAGLHNFRQHFWVTSGSRIYGPLQQPGFNLSQDICADVDAASGHPTYGSLFRLLGKPGPAAKRVLTALRWYSSANREDTDDYVAIVHLAIAFEALLSLPQSEKTDRLVDAISLLLGRVPRLDSWARQFYDARSRIVHEGQVESLRFVTASGTQKREAQLYQSLFAYGSQVFRLCLGTLLAGSELAEAAALAEKFVTNQERYTELCKILSDNASYHTERFQAAAELTDAVERYRFVGETGLQVDTMIGAVRAAARTLLDSGIPVEATLADGLKVLIQAGKTKDDFAELDALRALNEAFPDVRPADAGVEDVVRRLVKNVWGSLFMHYYWLKKRRT